MPDRAPCRSSELGFCLRSRERATFTPSPASGLYALPMATRNRLLITAAVLCHLLLAPRLVTSQLLAAAAHPNLPQAPPKVSQPVTISAIQQEKDGPIYKLHGAVKIDYGVYTLTADDVTYNSDSGD